MGALNIKEKSNSTWGVGGVSTVLIGISNSLLTNPQLAIATLAIPVLISGIFSFCEWTFIRFDGMSKEDMAVMNALGRGIKDLESQIKKAMKYKTLSDESIKELQTQLGENISARAKFQTQYALSKYNIKPTS